MQTRDIPLHVMQLLFLTFEFITEWNVGSKRIRAPTWTQVLLESRLLSYHRIYVNYSTASLSYEIKSTSTVYIRQFKTPLHYCCINYSLPFSAQGTRFNCGYKWGKIYKEVQTRTRGKLFASTPYVNWCGYSVRPASLQIYARYGRFLIEWRQTRL